jgi:hypothetical protein
MIIFCPYAYDYSVIGLQQASFLKSSVLAFYFPSTIQNIKKPQTPNLFPYWALYVYRWGIQFTAKWLNILQDIAHYLLFAINLSTS